MSCKPGLLWLILSIAACSPNSVPNGTTHARVLYLFAAPGHGWKDFLVDNGNCLSHN